MPISNTLAKAQKLAVAEAKTSDWLSKAKSVAIASAPTQRGKFEKLPALKLQDWAKAGSNESPSIIIAKALNAFHETKKLKDDRAPERGNKWVIDVEVLECTNPEFVPAGKGTIWADWTVLEQELKEYQVKLPNQDLTGQIFMIAAYGKQKKVSDPRQSVYPFRVLAAPQ